MQPLKITWPYLIKGVVYAFLLMLGTLIGVAMRKANAQGFDIWATVAIINVFMTIIVFYMLKKDLTKKETKKEPPKYESSKDKSPTKAEASVTTLANATPADIKATESKK